MSLRRWLPALLAALALAGCKSHDEPSSTAQEPAKPAAAPAPTPPPAAKPAPAPAPASGPALSYLKDSGEKGCDWVRQALPSGEPVVVYSFKEPCNRATVSWSPEGKEGLVFVPSADPEVPPRAWRVDLAARTGKVLDLKGVPGSTGAGEADTPAIEELGFDKQGRPVALLEDMYVERKPVKKGKQQFVEFEGQRYPLEEGEDGAIGLAHAYRLEEGGWKHVETKASHFESDLAPGLRKLDAVKTLLPVVPEPSLGPNVPGDESSEDAAKKLDAAFPPHEDEEGQWMTLGTPGGKVYFRASQQGEFLAPSVPVLWEQGEKLVLVKGLSAKPEDSLELQVQDGFLLIANEAEPRSAQVWDTKTKERVFSAEQASAPAFWPKPGGP